MTHKKQASAHDADLPVVNAPLEGASTVTSLIHLTSFDYAQGIGYLPVYVNAAQLAYVQARRRYNSKDDDVDMLDGTLLYFQQEAGVLAVREPIDEVLAVLAL